MSFDLKLARECAQAISAACGVGCVVTDARGAAVLRRGVWLRLLPAMPGGGPAGRRIACSPRSTAWRRPPRFGGKYIYFCPMGLTCFVSPILEDEEVTAKLTVGPFLMVDRQDFIACDLEGQMGLCGHPLEKCDGAAGSDPLCPGGEGDRHVQPPVHGGGISHQRLRRNRMLEVQGSPPSRGRSPAYIQQVKNDSAAPPYPLETERALLRAVRNLNKAEAQRRLNELDGLPLLFLRRGSGQDQDPDL